MILSAFYSGALVIPYCYDTGANAKWGLSFSNCNDGQKIVGPSSFPYTARITYIEREYITDAPL